MREPRPSFRMDVTIRTVGALSLAAAWACASALFASRPELLRSGSEAVHVLLATAAFLGASSGAACLASGRHLFDRVAVARPWGGGDIAYLRRDD